MLSVTVSVISSAMTGMTSNAGNTDMPNIKPKREMVVRGFTNLQQKIPMVFRLPVFYIPPVPHGIHKKGWYAHI